MRQAAVSIDPCSGQADETVEGAIASLSGKLAGYADTLSDQERRVLHYILYWATDPVERMALGAPKDLFSAEELETLRRIEDRER
jgi:hypothetical protein